MARRPARLFPFKANGSWVESIYQSTITNVQFGGKRGSVSNDWYVPTTYKSLVSWRLLIVSQWDPKVAHNGAGKFRFEDRIPANIKVYSRASRNSLSFLYLFCMSVLEIEAGNVEVPGSSLWGPCLLCRLIADFRSGLTNFHITLTDEFSGICTHDSRVQ
jgi:hypothetical protein